MAVNHCMSVNHRFLGAGLVPVVVLAALVTTAAEGQDRAMNDPSNSLRNPHHGRSGNVHVVGHLPLGWFRTTADIEIEQELSRPFAYMPRRDFLPGSDQPHRVPSKGVDIIGIEDPTKPVLLYSWRIDQQESHNPAGGMDNKYFKLKGRYYDVASLQFRSGGLNADVGAAVLDVTGLPDTSMVKLVGLIRTPDTPGGFHNIFAYKHSDGRVLLLATVQAPHANVYDMERFLSDDAGQGLISRVPVPELQNTPVRGYHDFYVGYDPATRQDKFYGAGVGGYYVFDVSTPEEPQLLTSVTGVAGVTRGHTFTPTPDGRYAVTEVEYQYAPLRLFDLKPGLDGEVKNISRPIGAWLASWDGLAHNHEIRWPYVFVSGYMDGLQIFNMMNPTNPYTVGYYYTCECVLPAGAEGAGQRGGLDGAFGVDVRNADGLIVISDKRSGFWAFKMDGFNGWNGHQWGMPNISSVQDWDNGPDGAPVPSRAAMR